MRRISWLILWSALFVVSPVDGAVIQVPVDSATIGGAVALAAPGDTVLIDCGIYTEHDILLSQDITILGATGSPDCVVIDALGLGRVFHNDVPTASVVVHAVTVRGGTAPGTGTYGTWGGGMLLLGPAPEILDCVFSDNTAEAGGGLATGGHGPAVIEGCRFVGNDAAFGGGVLTFVGSPVFEGCVFDGNSADSTGGAIEAYLSQPTIRTSTFYDNSAGLEGGVLFAGENSTVTVENSILSFSAAGEAVACDGFSSVALTCSDVYGNAGGDWVGCISGQNGVNGNIGLDPLLCQASAGDFGLQAVSPCRPANHPDGPACGLIGASGETCSALGIPGGNGAAASLVVKAWPNPFHGSLRFVHNGPGPARVSIHDLRGRVLRAYDGVNPGEVVVWDGTTADGRSVSAGTYYLRMDSNSGTAVSSVLRLH